MGKALRGTAPGESLHMNYVTMFEGEGLLVLKVDFSGFIMLWDAKSYNTDEVVRGCRIFGDGRRP